MSQAFEIITNKFGMEYSYRSQVSMGADMPGHPYAAVQVKNVMGETLRHKADDNQALMSIINRYVGDQTVTSIIIAFDVIGITHLMMGLEFTSTG